jgi:hypothetical protein
MAQITNTTDDLFYLGDVELKPHSTTEVPDDVVTRAKMSKAILGLFAMGKLASGATAAKREAQLKENPPYTGPPSVVHYKQPTSTEEGFVPRPTKPKADGSVAPPPKPKDSWST